MDYISLNPNGTLSKKYRKMQKKLSDVSYSGCDKRLKPRINQYLETVKDVKTISVDSIVNDLRKTYSEYSRKKRSSFKLSVIKAYNVINCEKKSISNDTSPDSQPKDDADTNRDTDGLAESDFSEDNENYIYFEDKNSVNKSICDLYKKSTPKRLESAPRNLKSTKKKLKSILRSGETTTESKNSDETPIEKQEIEPKSLALEIESSSVSKKRKANVSSEPNEIGSTVAKRSKKKEVLPQQSQVNFADVGGNEKCLEEVCKMLVHLKHPEVYVQLGVQPPRGLLLHGPPGCGKTLLAHAIAGELEMPFIKVAATEIVTGVSGESEEKIRDLFGKAVSSAPCVLFIDEIDAITPKRETAQREMERRIVAQLLICMDDLNSKDIAAQVLVIGATNRPDALDPALRRAGRFDREISMGIPDQAARNRILKVLCRNLKLEPEFDYADVARNTPGYVGADLMALTRESAMCAINRVFQAMQAEKNPTESDVVAVLKADDCLMTSSDPNAVPMTSVELALSWLRDQPPLTEQQLRDLFVEMRDFKLALEFVQPSAKREGFATVPDVTWDDIGALSEIREELQLSILAPVRHPEKFKALGLSNPAGILLCGPPGCGKTLLAKAVANESGVNFISVKGPELLNMYVGESERAVRQCFQRARNSAPCVIFFDELDALCPKRSDSGEGSASSRVVNQLLTEMDGMDSRKDVFILGATNRPDIIDPAVMRPGRLDKVLYVGLPAAEDRFEILKTLTKNGTKPVLEKDVCLRGIAFDSRCNGFTGADLSALIREASVAALKEFITASKEDGIRVGKRHFEAAFGRVRLSVSPKDQRMYDRMRRDFTKVGVEEISSAEQPEIQIIS